jgi:hypothetical protein
LPSLSRVLGPRIALGGALLACACQHDSDAAFDDSHLPSADSGGSGRSQSGSGNLPDQSGSGGSATTGGRASAGGASGGKPPAGGAGGKGGGVAGKGGAEMGGSGGQTPDGGRGGSAGSVANGGAGTAGTGGKPTDPPEPMTYETKDIDDTDVQSCMPNMNFGSLDGVNVDGDFSCVVQTLINVPLGGVPDGALVSDATLTLTCINVGEPVTISYVNEDWAELQVRWNNRPEAGTSIGTLTCAKLGEMKIDLTAAVKAWLAGDHKNYGIYLRTDNTDGTDFSSSEAANDAVRPLLSVTYTLPVK